MHANFDYSQLFVTMCNNQKVNYMPHTHTVLMAISQWLPGLADCPYDNNRSEFLRAGCPPSHASNPRIINSYTTQPTAPKHWRINAHKVLQATPAGCSACRSTNSVNALKLSHKGNYNKRIARSVAVDTVYVRFSNGIVKFWHTVRMIIHRPKMAFGP